MRIFPFILVVLFFILAGSVSSPAQNAASVEPLLLYKAQQVKKVAMFTDKGIEKCGLFTMVEDAVKAAVPYPKKQTKGHVTAPAHRCYHLPVPKAQDYHRIFPAHRQHLHIRAARPR